MTTIEKLSIQGIRSYSPNAQQIIEFEKPLTIIVGENGSGKTTVIECLKYATTGDYPPNSSNGQAFVHDPKLEGDASVKATVRLRFTTSTGKPITATRVLELKQKAGGKQECHLLSAALATISEDGQPISHTLRCADIGSEVPQLMGVSKAILENVIFCHQEDSNWPMQDGKKLKAKFDDIFAATRYTKALEELRKQRKTLADTTKEQSLKLDTLRVQREHAHKLTQESQDLHEKNQQTLERQGQLKQSMKKDQEQIDALSKAISEGAERQDQLREIDQKHRFLEESLALAEPLLQRFAHLSELQLNENLHSSDASLLSEVDLRQQEFDRFQLTKQAAEKEKNDLHLVLSQFEMRRDQELKLLTMRQQLTTDIAQQLHITVPTPASNSFSHFASSYTEFKSLLTRKEEMLEAKIAKLQQRLQTLIEGWQLRVDDARSAITSLESRRDHHASDLKQQQTLVQQAQSSLHSSQQLVGQLSKLEKQLEDENNALNSLEAQHSETVYNEKLLSLNQQQESLSAQFKEIEAEFTLWQKNQSKFHEVQTLEDDCQKITLQTQELLSQLPSTSFSIADPFQLEHHQRYVLTAEADFVASQDAYQQALQQQRSLVQVTSQLAGQLQSSRAQLSQYQSRVIHLEKEISQKLSPDASASSTSSSLNLDVDTMLAGFQGELQRTREDLSQTKSAQELYRVFIEQASQSHDCPLCGRHFENPHLTHQFIDKLEAFLNAIQSEDLTPAQTRLLDLEHRVAAMRQVESLSKELRELTTAQIPEIQALIQATESKRSSKEAKLVALGHHIDEKLQPALEEARGAQDTARKLLELARDRQQTQALLQQKLSELQRLTGVSEDLTSLSARQVQEKIESIASRLDALRNQRAEIDTDIRFTREALQKYRTDVFQLRTTISELSTQRLQMQTAGHRLSELQQAVADGEEKKAALQQALETLRLELTAARQTAEQVQLQRKEEESKISNQLTLLVNLQQQLRSKVVGIDSLNAQLSGFSQAHTSDLDATQARLAELESRVLPEMTTQFENLSAALYTLRDMLNGQENRRRELQEVLRYRQQRDELELVRVESQKLHQQISHGSGNLLQDRQSLERYKKQLELKREKIHNLEGRRYEFCQRIKKHESELNLPAVKEINETYRRQLIALRTNQLTVEDLDRYYEALDKALMRYHTLKMQEINKIIKQLWQSTYQGKEIDTIEIRAEVPAPSSTATVNRRSYNYRVVMIQGDTELDMNGRCSAGQKVLGSLIIRLALAETFCLSCGILALDEPTTNLDQRNVEGLALALSQIITSRRFQRNFQLLVITHDEEFVQLLGRADLANYYLRVSRNSEHHSIITRRDIHALNY